MHKELTDEAIVVIKRIADEDMVTYPRVKLTERTQDGKGEGLNMLTWVEVHEERLPRDKLIQNEHRPC